MRSLLYYLPRLSSAVTVEELRGLGLGYAFDDGRLTRVGVGCGPCDSPAGVVVSVGNEVGYYADCQAWLQIPGRDAWVGRYTDAATRPEQLARARQLDGHLVRMADGQEWLVPVARGMAERDGELLGWYPALPQGVTLDAQGQWQRGEVLGQYQALWQTACRWWDAYHAAEPEEDEGRGERGEGRGEETVRLRLSFADTADAAVQALAANYRVDRAEVSLLGLLDDRSIVEVLDALVDWPTLRAWLQKKTLATADT